MNATDAARIEIGLINELFQAHDIRAGIHPNGAGSLIAPMFWTYRVVLDTRQTPEGVIRLHSSIAEIISNNRQQPTPVRFQHLPLAIEVPSARPRSRRWTEAQWQVGPGKMLAGLSYSLFHGEQPFVLDTSEQHHVLVAGMSGAGKSTLMQMLVTSLAINTSPAHCQLWLVDRRNAELADLSALPQVVAHARTADESRDLIAALSDELERRVEERRKTPHIRLVVDELAALNDDKETCARINDILNRGRGNGIGSKLATQHPTQKAIGNISLANITVRCVGAVQDATTARFATGRPDTGAQYLPLKTGSFLYIGGPDVIRFQSYYIPEEEVPQMVAGIRKHWPTAERAFTIQPEPEAQPETEDIPPNVVETFRDFYDETSGELRRGGLTAIIRALFGPHVNTGGSYKRKADEVVQRLKATTTTAYAQEFRRYQPKTEVGKE